MYWISANLDVAAFRERILRFDTSYIRDWESWIYRLQLQQEVAVCFGSVLRKWQACRPNRMRRSQREAKHHPPYLEDLIAQAGQAIHLLQDFDLRRPASFTQEALMALDQLWGIFTNLSYQGRSRGKWGGGGG